jgi:hypothetical protein
VIVSQTALWGYCFMEEPLRRDPLEVSTCMRVWVAGWSRPWAVGRPRLAAYHLWRSPPLTASRGASLLSRGQSNGVMAFRVYAGQTPEMPHSLAAP